MKITEIVSIGGKKLSKPQINLLAKLATKYGLQNALFADLAEKTEETETRVNPFSKVSFNMTPLCAMLLDWVLQNYFAGKVGSVIPVNDWDRVKYFILEFWPEIYNGLID